MAQPCLMAIMMLTFLARLSHQVRGETPTWKTDPRTRKQYINLNKPLAHPNNTKACADISGMLPEPRDEGENDFLADLSAEKFRLGMTGREPNWTWLSDGSRVTWFNWNPGEPNGRRVTCVAMAGGKWTDTGCNRDFGTENVVCEKVNSTHGSIDLTECSNGKFGQNCQDCHCQDVCHKLTGICPTNCESGWQGRDCQQECEPGKFGQDCSRRCHCKDRNEACDRESGSCLSGCAIGHVGVDCHQECDPGMFGDGCSKECHCTDRAETCDHVNGSCTSGCAIGWKGLDCRQECSNGTFGQNCLKDCHCQDVCDKQSGICPTNCTSGWQGPDCQQECSPKEPCGIHDFQEVGGHFICSCLHGYENVSPSHCEDIDECKQGPVCGIHTCRNDEGSYECICRNESYENVAPQMCVLAAMDMDSMKNEEPLFPKEIKLLVVIMFLSLYTFAFCAYVTFRCALTVVLALQRYLTTKPCKECKERFIKEFHSVVITRPRTQSEDDVCDVISLHELECGSRKRGRPRMQRWKKVV